MKDKIVAKWDTLTDKQKVRVIAISVIVGIAVLAMIFQ